MDLGLRCLASFVANRLAAVMRREQAPPPRVLVLVGLPASGKTTLAHLLRSAGWAWVNQVPLSCLPAASWPIFISSSHLLLPELALQAAAPLQKQASSAACSAARDRLVELKAAIRQVFVRTGHAG